MHMKQFPVIDPVATGKNIVRLRTNVIKINGASYNSKK